jgi:autotransporter-associated beta strand protein
MPFVRRCALFFALTLIVLVAPLHVRADSITGTGWTGKGANNNWNTSGNWDNTPPRTDGTGDRNLFYGQGYFNAGNNGFTTSNNNLTSWAGYRITFQDISGQPDVSFTITGNGFTLFDFGGNFPKIENSSNVTQTFTLTSGQTITLQGGSTGKTEINPINGNIVFSSGTNVQLNSPLDIFGNFGNRLIFNGVVSGGSGNPITLQQNSIVELNAANTYTGNTNIKAGTVIVGANAPSGSAGALGNSTAAVTLGDTTGSANASLLTSGAFTVGRNVEVRSGNTGTATIGGNTAAASTYSGSINLGTASGTAKGVTLVAASGGSVNFSGVIDENTSVPASGVTIGSAMHTGAVRLSNTGNGYGGVTTVNGVVLEVTELDSGGSNSSIGNSSGVASNLVLSGGTLRFIGGGNASTNRLFTFDALGGTLDANAAVIFGGGGSLVASGTGNRTLSLIGSGNGTLNSTIANPSVGATALVKNGNGTWTLGGANSYSGGTTVSGGTLLAANSSGSATGSGNVTIDSGATLTIGNGGPQGAVSGNITVNGTVQFNRNDDSTHASSISGTGSLVKQGPRSLTLTGTNTYSGGTTVSSGTLRGSTNSVQGDITNNATVEFDQAATGTYAGTMSGTGQLRKVGGGTLSITSANTHGGGTVIAGGTLQANNTSGSATGTGAVTVATGGTLAGTGAISGPVTVHGKLAPGNSIESLDIGALSFGGTSTFEVELNTNAPLSVGADLVNANGALSIAAGAILSLTDAGNTDLANGTKFTLISYAGTWDGGIFLNRPDDSLVTVGVNDYMINYDDTTGGLNFGGGSYGNYVTLTAVPEASAFLFGGLGCLIAGLIYSTRKLRRRRAVAASCPRS